MKENYNPGTFGYDLSILENGKNVVLLKQNDGKTLVAVSPAWQGRVMTSSFAGLQGKSLGWINNKLIQSGKTEKHINAFGGEDRFWMGPEGGQFSIYFKSGMSFDFENWNVPKEIDTEPFDLVNKNDTQAFFRKAMNLVNYSGNKLDVLVEREINLLNCSKVSEILGLNVDSLEMVAYESVNKITNTGNTEWTKKTGMLSIWILGMFQPSPSTTVVVPFRKGQESELGPKVNDTYFGKISVDRLKIKDNVIFFKADGKERGKLGISPKRAKPFLGAYNMEENVLTIVNFHLPDGAADYVNSMWELQEEPFAGDVVNSYNDGPLEDGSQMGPFFEMESSSPAGSLKPGSSLTHIRRTIHLTGDKSMLNEISQKVLGSSLAEICSAF